MGTALEDGGEHVRKQTRHRQQVFERDKGTAKEDEGNDHEY